MLKKKFVFDFNLYGFRFQFVDVAWPLIAIALAACGRVESPVDLKNEQVTPAPMTKHEDQTKATMFRDEMSKESVVVDYLYEPANAVQLTVAVKDDGTKRYGLAGYFCQKLRQAALYGEDSVVRIIDADRLIETNGDFRAISLGTVSCKDATRRD